MDEPPTLLRLSHIGFPLRRLKNHQSETGATRRDHLVEVGRVEASA